MQLYDFWCMRTDLHRPKSNSFLEYIISEIHGEMIFALLNKI